MSANSDDRSWQSPAAATGKPPEGAAVQPAAGPHTGLTDTEVAILAMEQSWWKYPGAKESAVRERFDISLTRYYQVLNALIDKAAALEIDPVTVNRLRRLRADRQRSRSSRRDRGTAS